MNDSTLLDYTHRMAPELSQRKGPTPSPQSKMGRTAGNGRNMGVVRGGWEGGRLWARITYNCMDCPRLDASWSVKTGACGRAGALRQGVPTFVRHTTHADACVPEADCCRRWAVGRCLWARLEASLQRPSHAGTRLVGKGDIPRDHHGTLAAARGRSRSRCSPPDARPTAPRRPCTRCSHNRVALEGKGRRRSMWCHAARLCGACVRASPRLSLPAACKTPRPRCARPSFSADARARLQPFSQKGKERGAAPACLSGVVPAYCRARQTARDLRIVIIIGEARGSRVGVVVRASVGARECVLY